MNSAFVSAEAVKTCSAKLDVGERTVRLDLEALRAEIEGPTSDELPRDLLEAIQQASTFRLLKALGERVMLEMVHGTISRELGKALTDALREQRHTLRAMRDEQGHAALKALEILTPQEHGVLKAYRESLVPKALKPGEFPPPPSDEPDPDEESALDSETETAATPEEPPQTDASPEETSTAEGAHEDSPGADAPDGGDGERGGSADGQEPETREEEIQ